MDRRHNGFNIFELMTSLALLSLLGSVAIPAYTDYAERVQLNRAIGDISRISVEIGRWRTDNLDALPARLADMGISAGRDPWGNRYVYSPARVDRTTNTHPAEGQRPVNSDFDLYSYGPDGQTDKHRSGQFGADDIVRVNDGAFIGMAREIQ